MYGKVNRTVSINDKLQRHLFLVTALPRPLLGWDFLRTHHAVIKAAPEEVQFCCRCPDSSGPMETLERYTPVSRPMRHHQHTCKSVLSAASSLYKARSTGLTHSDFRDLQLKRDQYQRSGRNCSSDHLLLLSRNLESTTTSL